jgi:hypothetical protein
VTAVLRPAAIADARSRQRRRRLLVVGAVALLVGAGVLAYSLIPRSHGPKASVSPRQASRFVPRLPPVHHDGVLTMVVGGGETDPHELLPFDRPIGIFERPRTQADTFVVGSPEEPQTAGKPLADRSRLFRTSTQDIYVVPTNAGAVCFWLADAQSCRVGLQREGVNWFMANNGSETDLVFVGVAAHDVSRIELVSAHLRRRATLSGDIWSVDWPNGISAYDAASSGESAGRLVIHYRDGRRPATITLG